MKTETEIVASHEARRRIKLEAMKEVRVRMGIKEKYDEKNKEGTKGRRKKGRANVKRYTVFVFYTLYISLTQRSIKLSTTETALNCPRL